MSTFEAEVAKVQAAQREILAADNAIEARRSAVAKAWRLRPGGTAWQDLLAAINAGLPVRAWLTYATLRSDERLGRSRRETA